MSPGIDCRRNPDATPHFFINSTGLRALSHSPQSSRLKNYSKIWFAEWIVESFAKTELARNKQQSYNRNYKSKPCPSQNIYMN